MATLVKRVEAHDARPAPTQRRTSRQQLGTGQGQHEDRCLGGCQEVVQEVQQALVGVMGVVDHQHDHLAHRAEVLQERRPCREQVLPGERRPSAGAQQHGQPRPQPVAIGLLRARTSTSPASSRSVTVSPVSASTSPNRARIASARAQNATPSP